VPAVQVVRQVREAQDRGVQEVVLTGVNLAAWGCDDTRRPAGARLPELLEDLLRATEMPRIRLSSLGPQYLDDGFFGVLADPRICDHLHLSVQSGSAAVLRRMERGHDALAAARVAEAARRVRPDVALTADLIAGFPGETDAEHGETLGLVEAIGFSKLHVFPYSAREGTPAASLPGQVPVATRKARARELRAVGQRLREVFLRTQYGKPAQVLAECDGTGLTTNYIRLRVSGIAEGEVTRTTVAPEDIAERW
jgi:threonylcarbamoyladenosine tRNA methylthiotransferase MtaB